MKPGKAEQFVVLDVNGGSGTATIIAQRRVIDPLLKLEEAFDHQKPRNDTDYSLFIIQSDGKAVAAILTPSGASCITTDPEAIKLIKTKERKPGYIEVGNYNPRVCLWINGVYK